VLTGFSPVPPGFAAPEMPAPGSTELQFGPVTALTPLRQLSSLIIIIDYHYCLFLFVIGSA
jgi:hypothetical protein